MIRALLIKELRQHTGLFILLLCSLFAGLVLVTSNVLLSRSIGSGFAGLKTLLFSLLPVAAMLLGNALIASEFRHKTQLFLEGLPVPRWKLLTVKYAVMQTVLLFSGAALLLGAWVGGWKNEAMTLRFASLLATKTFLWIACIGGFFFALAFLGRYRIAAAVALFFGLLWLEPGGMFDLDRSAPFALLDSRFAFERQDWPLRNIALSTAWAAAFVGLGFFLGSLRDATVASLLAEKMSSREKIAITLLSFAGMMLVGTALDRKMDREPIHLPGALVYERGEGVRIELASTRRIANPVESEKLKLAGSRLADEIENFSRELGGAPLPVAFVVHRPGMDANEFEGGSLEFSQGTLLRANVLDGDTDRARFYRRVIDGLLEAKTSGRSEMEAWAWIADGLTAWRQQASASGGETRLSTEKIDAAKRAAQKIAFSSASLREWLRVRKNAGDEDADALAGFVFESIARKKGAAAAWRFALACFSADVPEDLRGWWQSTIDPPEKRLLRTTGMNFDQLADCVIEYLRQA